jgi:competence protein ComEA
MRRITRIAAMGILCGFVLAGGGRGALAAGAPAAEASHRVNINTASAAELAALPGIGPAKAQAIIEHRSQEPFATADDLRKVKGIGEKLYDRIKDQVTVGEPPAVGPKGRGS